MPIQTKLSNARHRARGAKRRKMSSTFIADRRDPTDRRSSRQTPVFVGDIVAHVDKPSWWMVVTGVRRRGRVEVVNVTRVEDALGAIDDLDGVEQALRDGRI